MSNTHPHFAKNIFLACIDDRLVAPDAAFAAQHGGSFHIRLAGGGGAVLDPASGPVAIAQAVASYRLSGLTDVYIQSHLDCGGYRLSGVTFASPDAEVGRLYRDLDQAAEAVRQALVQVGAPTDEITVHTRVVDPAGRLVERP